MNETRRGAVFFDRDGTLNVDKAYLYRAEDFEWIPGAIEAVRLANERGLFAVVVTNQSGVARGYYTEDDVMKLHRWMNGELQKHGAHIDAFYYCPHLPESKIEKYAVDCECRKPKPGLVERAVKELDIDKARSVMIGDKPRDVECARAAGIPGALYEGGSLAAALEKFFYEGENFA